MGFQWIGCCSCRELTYLKFALQNVEAVFKLSVHCGHLGQFSFEGGVVLLPEGKVLSCCCQASLGSRARTHGWAVTGGVMGPYQAALKTPAGAHVSCVGLGQHCLCLYRGGCNNLCGADAI